MSAWTLTHTTSLVTEDCYACGITFAMPTAFRDVKLRDRTDFYCPNGHRQHYIGETDAEKLRRVEARNRALHDQLDASERSKRAHKAAATRARNQVVRAEKGVCPHCKRSFQDLRRHMESKHL